MFGSSSKELSIDHVQVVAFYDPKTGDIRHLHTVTTVGGAKRVSKDEALEEAKEYAYRHHNNVESFSVAFSDEAEHAYRPHKIDLKTKAFVPVKRDRTKAQAV